MTDEPVVYASDGAAAGVISAAEELLGELKNSLQLDDSPSSLERLQAAMDRHPGNRTLWLAGGVYVGRLLLRMVPGEKLMVKFTSGQPAAIILEANNQIIPLVEWPPDPDSRLPFTFRGAQWRLRITKGVAGGRPFCIKCGHSFSRDEVAQMEEFRLRNGRRGRRRACPDCGTAFLLVGGGTT